MDRLTAMAVLRLRHVRKSPPLAAQVADDAALIAAARTAPEAAEVAPALRFVRGITIVTGGSLLLLGGLAGAATVRAVLGAGGSQAPPVNVLVVLSSLLFVQSAALLLWTLLLALRLPAMRGAVIGRLHRFVVVRLARRAGAPRADAGRAATGIAGSVLSRGPVARWTVAAATHGFWSGFNLGAAAVLLVLLSTRQYAFGWETTILPEQRVAEVVRGMGAAPRALGFPSPDEVLVAQSRTDRMTQSHLRVQEGREAWAGFILGCTLVYGLSPRMLLLGLSLTLRRRALSACWFSASDPDLIAARAQPVADRDDSAAAAGTSEPYFAAEGMSPRGIADAAATGSPAIIGFEIEPPGSGWPPRLHDQRWHDLGIVESSSERRAAAAALGDPESQIGAVVAVAELAAVPDRGAAGFFAQLAAARPGAVRMLLTGAERLRARGGAEHVVRRAEQWRVCAEQSGIDPRCVAEVDLDHLTESARRRFAALLAGDSAGLPPEDARADEAQRFDQGMARLRAFVHEAHRAHGSDGSREATGAAPGVKPAAAAALHADLLRLYGAEPGGRTVADALCGESRDSADDGDRLRRAVRTFSQHPGAMLEQAAGRMLAHLPPLVLRESRWVVAGAFGGALACAGAALIAAPAAAAALPAWSIFGAAATAAVRGLRAAGSAGVLRSAGEADDSFSFDHPDRLSTRLVAATVHLLVLDGQSMEAPRAARVIEAVLTDLPAPADDRIETLDAFLNQVQHARRHAIISDQERASDA